MSGKRSLMYGVGVNDWHTLIRENGAYKVIPEYEMWRGMLKRVYCTKSHQKHPAYKGTTVDPNWHSMTAFIEDVSTLIGYDKALTGKWQLDKDILSNGGKHYSKDTCCFIPRQVNTLITNRKPYRGEYPCGVTKRARGYKYEARLSTFDQGRLHLGDFKTPEEAFYVYKEAREAYVKRIANLWKDEIDTRVYDILMAWEVNIDD